MGKFSEALADPNRAIAASPDNGNLLVMRAILEASAYIDDPKHRAQVAKTIGAAASFWVSGWLFPEGVGSLHETE